MLNSKGFDYADIWLPHDAVAKTLQTGRSTVEQFLSSKLPAKVVPRLAVQHGIDAARLLLKNVRIDHNNCSNGIEALRAYKRQYNEKTQQFSNAPLHDWASNGADAFRYFALVTEENVKPVQIEDETPTGPTLDEMWAENEQWDWRKDVIRL